jgi:hypothetical protein
LFVVVFPEKVFNSCCWFFSCQIYVSPVFEREGRAAAAASSASALSVAAASASTTGTALEGLGLDDSLEDGVRVRVGALVVEALGQLMPQYAAFNTAHGLVPLGYRATREFWGGKPNERCVYTMDVEESELHPRFQIVSSEGFTVTGQSADDAWAAMVSLVGGFFCVCVCLLKRV